jgi:hypothetical protein
MEAAPIYACLLVGELSRPACQGSTGTVDETSSATRSMHRTMRSAAPATAPLLRWSTMRVCTVQPLNNAESLRVHNCNFNSHKDHRWPWIFNIINLTHSHRPPALSKGPPSTLRMTSVEGTSDAQPATSNGSATIPDTRDEKASPRSEAGIERINPSDYDEWSSVHT